MSISAFLKTEGLADILMESKLIHSHEKIPKNLLNRQILSNGVRRAGAADLCERSMKIIRSEIQKLDA